MLKLEDLDLLGLEKIIDCARYINAGTEDREDIAKVEVGRLAAAEWVVGNAPRSRLAYASPRDFALEVRVEMRCCKNQ